VIPGDSKWYRKLVIGEIMVAQMEGMNLSFPEPEEGLEEVVIE
jgi:hypothetical protein